MRSTLKAIAPLVAAWIIVVGFFSWVKKDLTEDQIYQETASKTFRILNPDNTGSGGTGFYLTTANGTTLLVTNQHVCDMTEKSYVVAEQQGVTQRVDITDIAGHTDLCVLQAPNGATGLTLASDVGGFEKVYIVGHPFLYPVTISSGYLNERSLVKVSYCNLFNTHLPKILGSFEDIFEPACVKAVDSYASSARSAPGNSGSAVVNGKGEVVGVLFAGDGRGFQSRIIPLDVLTEYVNQF
jgi:S1-C subfamily serine protease